MSTKKETPRRARRDDMDYTVTLKLWFPDGSIRWAVRYCCIEAPDESNALLYAKMRLANDTELKDCKVIEARFKEYEGRDSFTFDADKERWELEEENKNAPALIARALDKMSRSYSVPKTTPKRHRDIYILAVINLGLSLVLMLLLILKG